MPKLEYFVVSESYASDRDTNQLSLFNILEEVLTVLPVRIARLVATSSWNIRPEDETRDFQVTLRIHRPSGEVLRDPEDIAANFTAGRGRQRVHNDIRGLLIEEAGDFRFEILLNGAHAADHIITIRARDESA